MYGDCQVISTDSLFSSPIRNPNMGFITNMPFHPFSSIIPKEECSAAGMMGRASGKEEEMESGSMGSGHVDVGGVSCGEEHDDNERSRSPPLLDQQPPAKKKRYHRHTARQIQEMEALFKECPHPDDKQRLKLSQDLGLKPRQVKFWFQNRRTQMKAQQDRADNVILRAENESLKNDSFRLQSAIRNVVCPRCGGPAILGEMSFDEQHLRIENARLKDELERLSCIAARFGNGTMVQPPPMLMPSLDLDMSMYSRGFHEPHAIVGAGCSDIIPVVGTTTDDALGVMIMDQDKGMALNLAITAADQLSRMCRASEPLWVRSSGGGGGGGGGGGEVEVLNVEEFDRLFPWPVDFERQGGGPLRTEATRDSTMVIMNSITLVDAFLDANKWMELFPSIVSKAKTLQIITPGISGHGNGSLHLMYAEFHLLTPLVPTREVYFLRYCQQNAEERTWTVVDFPIDGFQGGHQLMMPFARCRRRPSGCIIQDMPNGYSRVMWVEHTEVEDAPVHQVFHRFVNSGMAFGATRWLSVLNRQCERLASLMARNISDLGVIPSPEARKNMMKLSQRMVRTFCANISSSGNQAWTALSESSDDTVRVVTRKNGDPGQPNGVILTAVSTTWLPFPHHQVFDLLTDEHRRSQLDFVSNGNSLHEVAHIANGSHPRNCVSLLRINSSNNQNVELLLQESSTHPSGGSLVIYATIDVNAVQVAMGGEDPSYIPLLPTGFVLFPAAPPQPNSPKSVDGSSSSSSATSSSSSSPSGCLLTVVSQVLASAVPSAKLNLSSVASVSAHLCNTVHQITAALGGGGGGHAGASQQPDVPASAAGH